MPYKVGLPPEQRPPQTTGVSLISNKPVTVVTSGDRKSKSVEAEDNLAPIRAWVVQEVQGENGELRAVLICSAFLEDHLWMVWDRSFQPKDNLAVYYAEEIPLLKGKSLEDLQEIHRVKLIFPGCRVIQG
ncbi:MAG: hypothetical protein V3T23_09130 [Nitrososphaerales archaeon]